MWNRRPSMSLLILCVALFSEQSEARRLRGPNVCYHYDIGRYCCEGFAQTVDGLCISQKRPAWVSDTEPFSESQRAHPDKTETSEIVDESENPVDANSRPRGVAASSGRESYCMNGGSYARDLRGGSDFCLCTESYQGNRCQFIKVPRMETPYDYYKPVDMEALRRLVSEGRRPTTSRPSVRPWARYPPGGGYRHLSGNSDQVIVAPNLIAEVDYQEDVAEVKQRPTIKIYHPISQETTTPLPEDHNRKFFGGANESAPHDPEPANKESNGGYAAQQGAPEQRIMFPACPGGYTLTHTADGTNICFPLIGLQESTANQNSDLAPTRGDGATTCETGHEFRSSQYGDACVPIGWEPCSSDDLSCDHTRQPIVNPKDVGNCYEIARSGVVSVPCTPDCDNSGGCGNGTSESEGFCMNGGTFIGDVRRGDMRCSCTEEWQGVRCNERKFGIYDVDECARGTHTCQYGCLNTDASYECICPMGATLNPDRQTCSFVVCPNCLHGGSCDRETNECICTAGFTGELCENDINECSTPGTCSELCKNTFGGFHCLCQTGFTLLPDRKTCVDYRCSPACVNGGACVRNRCQCPPGFGGIICQFNNRL